MTAHATETGGAPERTERSSERRAEPASAGSVGITRDDYRSLASRDTGTPSDTKLQLPPGIVQQSGVKFEAANYDSIAAILGLPQGARMPTNGIEAFALLGRLDLSAKTADWGGGTPDKSKPPHEKVFDASKVERGQGPYQVAQHLLGDGFTHKEKMQFVRALQAQYREDITSNPELNARKGDMSDLKVGTALLTKDNYDTVMDRLKASNPELAGRIGDALTHEPSAANQREHTKPERHHKRPGEPRGGSDPEGKEKPTREREKPTPPEKEKPTAPEKEKPDHHYSPGEQALKLVEKAKEWASRLGTSGWCSKGVRLALESMGIHHWAPNAVKMGRELQAGGRFERHNIPLSEAQPGDIIVRDWSPQVQRQKGANNGDIIVVTGRNRDGSLRGANDHHWSQIPEDGGRYRNSYVLRFKA